MGQASWPKSSRKGIGVYPPTGTLFNVYDTLIKHALRLALALY